MTYKVVTTKQKVVLCPQSLPWHGVLNINLKNGDIVVEKESALIEDTGQ